MTSSAESGSPSFEFSLPLSDRQHSDSIVKSFAVVEYQTARSGSNNHAGDALSWVGLGNKGKRLPNQISGGEKERVAVARAIVNEPPVLLADEPTGNLDTKTTQEIMGLLQRLNNDGMTIVMVTHSQECSQYAKRLLHVSDGMLHES